MKVEEVEEVEVEKVEVEEVEVEKGRGRKLKTLLVERESSSRKKKRKKKCSPLSGLSRAALLLSETELVVLRVEAAPACSRRRRLPAT